MYFRFKICFIKKILSRWPHIQYYWSSRSTGVFLWILRNFQEQLFSWNTSGGCFWKTKIRNSRPEVFYKNGFLMHCKNFLKVHKNTGEKIFAKNFSADGCLITVMMTTMLYSDTKTFAFTSCPWNEIWLEVLEWSIWVAARPFYLD